MNIAIIGKGNVGSALARALLKSGHSVTSVGNEPGKIASLTASADVIIFAAPFAAVDAVVDALGTSANGKVVVDVSNVLTPDLSLALGFTTSGAEELQKKLPAAKVVKAFNTVFAQHMETGHVKGEQITAFVAADDAEAKATVRRLAASIGFDAVDAGPLKNARMLEPMAFQNIQFGYVLGLGPDIGIKLVH
jgi:predicted dinucleotide-binding enzyme